MATTTIASRPSRQRWGLSLERFYPVGGAVLAAFACWGFELKFPLQVASMPISLLGSTVAFGAIVSGFVGASLTILTALATPLMRDIRRTLYIRILRSYLGSALASGIILSCTSILGMWVYQSAWFLPVWCAVFAFCLLCLFRLARLMLLIFSDPDNLPHI